MLVFRRQSITGLQVIDVKDFKFTACQVMYTFTYSKVKRINRRYVTHYTIKLTLEIRAIVIRLLVVWLKSHITEGSGQVVLIIRSYK